MSFISDRSGGDVRAGIRRRSAGGASRASARAAKARLPLSRQSAGGDRPRVKDFREASQQAATDDWLVKAKAAYPDADLANAKDVKWECVKQDVIQQMLRQRRALPSKAGVVVIMDRGMARATLGSV